MSGRDVELRVERAYRNEIAERGGDEVAERLVSKWLAGVEYREWLALLAERDAARQTEAALVRRARGLFIDYGDALPEAVRFFLDDIAADDRAALAVPDTEKGAEQVAQSAESADVRGGGS